mmetsp:Transcript_39793/g.35508  ORF Transcript_39793/g.35508 Transcript_39793/m.35508 type:complete len:90 (+) Transcript_39793:2011-2280(+)
MIHLNDCVYKIVEQKLEVVGYNADEEKCVMDILGKISNSKMFHKAYRDAALTWMNEIARPSRRYNKINIAEIEITRPEKQANASGHRTR